MNHEWVNVRAMEAAATALLGSERANVLKDLYRLLDNTEYMAFNEGLQQGMDIRSNEDYKTGFVDGREEGDQENFYSGYDKGFEDGNSYAFPSEQPPYHTPLHGTAAALQAHEVEQAPTPPADSPF